MDTRAHHDQRTPQLPAHRWSIAALCIATAGLLTAFGPPATSMLGAGIGAAGGILGGFSYGRKLDNQGVALLAMIGGILSVPVGIANLTAGYIALL